MNCVKIFSRDTILAAGGWRIINPFQTMLTQTLYKSFNACMQWNVYLDNDGGWLRSVEFTDAQNGFVVGWDGVILKTADGGESWTPVNAPVNRHFNRIFFIDPLTYIIAGGRPADTTQGAVQTILKSVNGGQTWNVVVDRPGFFLKSVYFPTATTGYAVGDSGTILKSSNAGLTWIAVGSPVARDFNSIWFSGTNNGIIIGGKEANDSIRTILRTTDGGNTWIVVKDELGGWLTDVTFVDADTGYAVGDRATVLKTTDGGQTWTSLPVPGAASNEYYNGVRFLGWDFGFIAGRWGANYIYNHEPAPLAYTMGAEAITATGAILKGNVNSLNRHARYSFVISQDAVFSNPVQSLPYDFRNNTLMPVQVTLSRLMPQTTYYYYFSAWTVGGITHGDTLSFFTGTPVPELQTLPATQVTTASATLNGSVKGFSIPVNLYFEYGITPALGNRVAAIPAAVNNALHYSITATISSLQPDTTYYFRLMGHTASGNYYGNTYGFYTGTFYTAFYTLPAQLITDTSAFLSGRAEGFKAPAYLSFDYSEETMNFGSSAISYPREIFDSLAYVPIVSIHPLQPGRLYFFRMKAATAIGTFYSDTAYFYTSISDTNLQTLTATAVTASSARLAGRIRNFSQPVSLSFEYGETPLLGNTVPANPAMVNDASEHHVHAALTGLHSNTMYYYRLKAQTASGNKFYSNIKQVFTGKPIPNWDFQDWESKQALLPAGWNMVGETFERVPGDSGGYALKISRTNFVFLGKFSLELSSGGVPFSMRPDSFYVNMHYNIEPGDTGIMGLIMRKGDTIIAQNLFGLRGSTGSGFAKITHPVAYDFPLMPDTLFIGFALFSLDTGSFMIIDRADFIPAGNVFNTDFESWFSYEYQKPVRWNYAALAGLDSSGSRPPMVSRGVFELPEDYAAVIRNVDVGGGTLLKGELSLQTPKPIDFPLLTFPVHHRHKSLNGFFQYAPEGGDTLIINVTMYYSGQVYGDGVFEHYGATSGFVRFEAPISYYNDSFAPDAAIISISCSKGSPRGLATLAIDKLSFDGYAKVSDDTILIAEKIPVRDFKVFPNPAASSVNILLPKSAEGTVEIYSTQGVRMYSAPFRKDNILVNVSNMPQGLYLIRIFFGMTQTTMRLIVAR